MQAVSLQQRPGIMVESGSSRLRSPKQAMKATVAYGVQARRKTPVRVRPTLATRISLRVLAASPLRKELTFILAACYLVYRHHLATCLVLSSFSKLFTSYLSFQISFVVHDSGCYFAVAADDHSQRSEVVPEPQHKCEKLRWEVIRHVVECAAGQIALWKSSIHFSFRKS